MTACSLELPLVTHRCGNAERPCQGWPWTELRRDCLHFPAEWASSPEKIDAHPLQFYNSLGLSFLRSFQQFLIPLVHLPKR